MDDLRLGDVLTCCHPFTDGRFLVVYKSMYDHKDRVDHIANDTSYITCVRLSTDSYVSAAEESQVGQEVKMHDVDINFAIKKGWLQIELP